MRKFIYKCQIIQLLLPDEAAVICPKMDRFALILSKVLYPLLNCFISAHVRKVTTHNYLFLFFYIYVLEHFYFISQCLQCVGYDILKKAIRKSRHRTFVWVYDLSEKSEQWF